MEHFHGPVAYVVCGLLVFGEAAVLLGFVIPGETAALIGGVLASLHHVNLILMLVVVVACAIVGDSVGYEVGKVLGPWLVERRPLRGHPGVNRGQALLARRGGPAVFLGRWVALARALVPGLSGMSGMRYRTFLAYNAMGGICGGRRRADRVRGGHVVRGGGQDGGDATRWPSSASWWLAVVVYVVVRHRRQSAKWGGAPAPGAEGAPGGDGAA